MYDYILKYVIGEKHISVVIFNKQIKKTIKWKKNNVEKIIL